jgi:hypothetical protein
VTPCNLVKRCQSFGRTCCLHISSEYRRCTTLHGVTFQRTVIFKASLSSSLRLRDRLTPVLPSYLAIWKADRCSVLTSRPAVCLAFYTLLAAHNPLSVQDQHTLQGRPLHVGCLPPPFHYISCCFIVLLCGTGTYTLKANNLKRGSGSSGEGKLVKLSCLSW